LEQEEAEFNADFLRGMLPKLDWPVLVQATNEIGILGLPEEMPENAGEDEEFLQKLHHVVMETRVTEGNMVCKGCGHVYRVKEGIPNMLLSEHEV